MFQCINNPNTNIIIFSTVANSEDSDYTSDIYPVGGQVPNSSFSQYLGVGSQNLATPQRSLETSRENSSERDDYQYPTSTASNSAYDRVSYNNAYNTAYSGAQDYTIEYDKSIHDYGEEEIENYYDAVESDLSYNSRPNNRKDYRCSLLGVVNSYLFFIRNLSEKKLC